MEHNELQETAANIISGLVNLGKFALSTFDDKTIDIYKGRHDNPIYKKIKGVEKAVIDKVKPLDRFHLIDKLQKPVSQDNSHSDHSNYRVEADGEIVFQESTDGKVNINQVGKFISQLLSPSLESEREDFTVADAFSSEYDPPQNNIDEAKLEEKQAEDYLHQQLEKFEPEPELEPELEEKQAEDYLHQQPYDYDSDLAQVEEQVYQDYLNWELSEFESEQQSVSASSQNIQPEPELQSKQSELEPTQNSQPELEQSPINDALPNSQVQPESKLETPAVNEPAHRSQSQPDKQNINAAYAFINRDIKSIKSNRIKDLFLSAFSRLRDRLNLLDKAVSRQFDLAEQKTAALTFKQLFDANLNLTGETTFKSNSFDVELKGANTYQVTDKQGNLKLEFHEKRFSGIKINQSSLSGDELKSVQKATQSVNSIGASNVLQQNLAQRLNSLGSLAPKSDHQIREDLDTPAVAKTANSFLHYMGVNSYNREGGAYDLKKSGNNLSIKDKESGQEILRMNNGKLSSKLKPSDIDYFRKLDSSMKTEVNKIREQQKNRNLTSELKSTPKRFNQQELSR